jgi:hypothetical protein
MSCYPTYFEQGASTVASCKEVLYNVVKQGEKLSEENIAAMTRCHMSNHIKLDWHQDDKTQEQCHIFSGSMYWVAIADAGTYVCPSVMLEDMTATNEWRRADIRPSHPLLDLHTEDSHSVSANAAA